MIEILFYESFITTVLFVQLIGYYSNPLNATYMHSETTLIIKELKLCVNGLKNAKMFLFAIYYSPLTRQILRPIHLAAASVGWVLMLGG